MPRQATRAMPEFRQRVHVVKSGGAGEEENVKKQVSYNAQLLEESVLL